jgi:hypothetical protein
MDLSGAGRLLEVVGGPTARRCWSSETTTEIESFYYLDIKCERYDVV